MPTEVCIVKAMVFPLVVYGCKNQTRGWVQNWCFWTVVLEKTPESPLDRREIKPVNPKGDRPWIFIGRTAAPMKKHQSSIFIGRFIGFIQDSFRIHSVLPMKEHQSWIFIGRFIGFIQDSFSPSNEGAEAEPPVLWPPDSKSRLIRKDPDAGKDWGQEEKGTTEDEMVGWHHCLNGHEFEQALRDNKGQGGLMCCSPWGLKESDLTERLNNNHLLKKNPVSKDSDNQRCWGLRLQFINFAGTQFSP